MRNWVLISLLSLILLVPASALGRYWSYEMVDAAGSWSNAEIEVMSGGTVCVCYQDTVTHAVMLASKDTDWRHDILGTARGPIGRYLVPGPGGKPATLMTTAPITYKVDTDNGWVETVLGWSGGGSVFLAFDTSGNPAVLWVFGDGGNVYLSSAKESASVWIQDTVSSWGTGMYVPFYAGNKGFVVDHMNHFYLTFTSELEHSGGSYRDVYLSTDRTGHWPDTMIAGGAGWWWWGSELSLAPRALSGASDCYNLAYWSGSDSFYCDGAVIDTLPASIGLVRVDAQDHRQIVYRTDRLRFAYETDGWNFDTLPSELGIPSVTSLDFALDTNGLPLIAFVCGTGVFLARGGPVTGCAEQKPVPVTEHLVLPTIVRGVLMLPQATSGRPKATNWLLDASGRCVAVLHPGQNDVSRFGAGVYFVRSAVSGQRSAVRGQGEVRKVVITR